jgi:hypothetical protein
VPAKELELFGIDKFGLKRLVGWAIESEITRRGSNDTITTSGNIRDTEKISSLLKANGCAFRIITPGQKPCFCRVSPCTE